MPPAGVMYAAGHHLLARTAFPCNENRFIRQGKAAGFVQQRTKAGSIALKIIE